MPGFFREHTSSLVLSVLLHGLLAAALLFAAMFTLHKPQPAAGQPLPIDAQVIDSQVLKAAQQQLADRAAQQAAKARAAAEAQEAAKAKAAEDARRVQDEAAQAETAQKAADAEKLAQAAQAERAAADAKHAAEQKRADDTQAAQRAAESKRADEAKRSAQAKAADDARKATELKAADDARRAADQRTADDARKAAEAKDKAARESELRRQMADEEHANSVASGPLADQYKAMLRNRIEHAWIRPPSASSGLDCVVEVTQVPGGVVTGVQVTQCNGDAVTRDSVANAVYRASPLPAPPDPALFVRSFSFHFHPDQ